MKVKVFEIPTTDGKRYGLVNETTGNVLHNATAKFKTAKGAERVAEKYGYELVK